jgi:hypothetical protein
LFEDRRTPAGVGAPSLSLTGFGTAFLDFDNDGRLDVVTVNGAVHLTEGRLPTSARPLPLEQAKQLFRNLDGTTFDAVGSRIGMALSNEDVGRGLAVGDIDNDGDPDLLIANDNGPARLLIDSLDPSPWIGLRLLDGRRDALGAGVTLHRRNAPDLYRHVHTDGSYASAGDPRVLFGLGAGGEVRGVDVRWGDGSVETFPAPPPGRYVTLQRGEGSTTASDRLGGQAR